MCPQPSQKTLGRWRLVVGTLGPSLGGGEGWSEKRVGGGKEEVEQARGRGRSRVGEEVNRFFAWEIRPRGEFRSCRSGRRAARGSPASGDCTCLPGAVCFSLRFPALRRPPGQGRLTAHTKGPLPRPLLGPATLPWGLDPHRCPPGGDPKLPFLRGRGSEGEETPTHARCSVRGDQTRGGNSPGNMPLLCR